jgi:hypothetical protein
MIDECFFLYALDLSIYIHVLFDILCDSCILAFFSLSCLWPRAPDGVTRRVMTLDLSFKTNLILFASQQLYINCAYMYRVARDCSAVMIRCFR